MIHWCNHILCLLLYFFTLSLNKTCTTTYPINTYCILFYILHDTTITTGGRIFNNDIEDPLQVDDNIVPERALCFSLCQKGQNDQILDYVMPSNVWTHVAFVSRSVPSHTIEFYVNGDLQDKSLGKFPLPIAYIGGIKAGQSFHGDIAEMRVWTYPRSSYELKRDMYREVSFSKNLFLHINFNEGMFVLKID